MATVMAYAVIAGFVSVVPQVFWPGAAAWAHAWAPDRCDEGLRALRSDLLDYASQVVTGRSTTAEPGIDRWLGRWDQRHIAMADRCESGPEADAHAALGRLRHRMETFLRRYDHEQGRLTRELDRHLDRLSANDSGDTSQ
ncbi:MAG: hypothetical protein ACODAU_06735 [Myxococcota bacterium]